jgi:hypothetical protein
MELPQKLTVQEYRTEYTDRQVPVTAGNLPIPAKLPVNRWDATLIFGGLSNFLCPMYQYQFPMYVSFPGWIFFCLLRSSSAAPRQQHPQSKIQF